MKYVVGLVMFLSLGINVVYAKDVSKGKDINILKEFIDDMSDGRVSQSLKLAKVIYAQSEKYRMNPYLILAVIQEESSFRIRAVSPKGALGLMQVMPQTGRYLASELGVRHHRNKDLFNPFQNVRMGIHYLAKLKKIFHNNEILYLTAYNVGPNRLKELLIQTPKKQLKYSYAKSILRNFAYFKAGRRIWLNEVAASTRNAQFE